MASGLFGIGASGLAAAYAGLQTAGHNIANVSTPGFRRQSIVQVAATPVATSAGAIGNGVHVVAVRQAYDELTTREVYRAQTRSSEASTNSSYLGRLDSMFADTETGLGSAIDDFNASIQAMTTSPSDTGQRAAFLGQARSLALRFTEMSDQIASLKSGAASDINASVANVNDLAKQIADINSRITLAGASGQRPNDLIDQRDELVRQVAAETQATPVTQPDGTINLFIGSGQPLVVGSHANSLSVVPDSNDPAAVGLALQTSNGTVTIGSNGSLMGGKLGALMNLNNQGFAQAEAELGRLATVVATEVNAQHAKGVDLDGVAGGSVFSIAGPEVDAASGNTGNAGVTVGIADATALKASDYRLDYDGTNYSVTRLSDNTKQTFGSLPQVVDGVQIAIGSGAMNAGDTFTLKPVSTRAGSIQTLITDPRKVALALPVTAKPSVSNLGSVATQSMTIDDASNANLKSPVTLTFTGSGTFDVSGAGTGNPTGQTFTAGSTISFNGWSITLTGTPKPGDTLVIGPNTNPSGDNRNALALSQVASGKIADGMTLSGALSVTLAGIGSAARSADLDSKVQGAILGDATSAEQSFSGVNLDEEAARLMQYQQAYQASAKVIATAQTVFDALLSIGH